MQKHVNEVECRREFLRLLAGSPLLALGGFPHGPWERLMAAVQTGQGQDVGGAPDVITSPGQAINVFDFEAAAKGKIPIAHFQYLEGGMEDGAMVRTNREGFTKFQIRDRRIVDVQKIDMSVNLFGTVWDTPIALAPCGSQKAFHPEGDVAVARAARAKGHLIVYCGTATSSVEEVIAARGAPVWYQLYATDDFDVTRALLKRAQAAGCPVVAFTVDVLGETPMSTAGKYKNAGCSDCHASSPKDAFAAFAAFVQRKRMFDGINVSKVTGMMPNNLTWDLVKRIKDATTMKLLIKGILTREDAQLAVENGVEGIIVSNHGGRQAPGTRSTIETLPEVLDGVGGKIPVLVDGGFRRGTDVFKALALGAKAIGIGRPYLWGLGAFGQPGVEAVLDMMRRELQVAMMQAGTTSIQKITRDYLIEHSSR